MNTTNAKTNFHCLIHILAILTLIFLVATGVATWRAAAQEPNPHFTVFPEWEFFDGLDWPDGATVTITVEGKTDCEVTKESWGGFFNGNFGEGCDVQIGDMVTFTDGTTIRTHEVRNLAVTGVDADAETVTGIADPDTQLYVWAHEHGESEVHPTAGGDGIWTADFTVTGFDLQEGMSGRSEIRDEMGNATAVDWHIPNPHFTVFPEWEFFDGLDWPDGATVTITVEGKPECEVTKESWGGFFNGNFGEGCDVQIGDMVTFTDGITTRTHVVRKLVIKEINVETDMITGKAHSNEVIYVWPHATGQQIEVTADKNGFWQANFNGLYDLAPGEGGRSEIRDDMGNATAVDWYISRPIFTIYPDAQWFDGNDFPDGASVEITVAGKPECNLEIESWGGFFGGNFPEGCFVTSGDFVTYKQGTTILTHTVHDLAIKIIDKELNTVSGVADSGEIVSVWAWNMDGSTVAGSSTEVIAAEDDSWTVNYNELGLDLVDGMGIQAMIRDPDGNGTSVDLPVPNTRIVASITENWFYLVDFLPGEPVDYTIYQSQGGELIWEYYIQADVNGFAWIDSEGRWDLEPGNYIVVTDGRTTKDLIIEGFTFDVFDTYQGFLQGTAPEPYGRRVWVGIGWENDGWSMDVSTDPDGKWVADFGAPVPAGYSWVAAQIFDQDGDASELRPSPRSLTAGNFYVAFNQTNPEEVIYLSWKGSGNLTNTWQHPYCLDDLEFFGNSWVTETESFWASLVGWGTTGTWVNPIGGVINIGSISSGCPGSAELPIQTSYQFFDDEQHANLIRVERTFEFGETPYAHDVRPFIPRFYPSDGYTQVLHPDKSGTSLVTDGTCDFGCEAATWDGSWFAIHNPTTGLGMIVQRVPSSYDITLWLDDDDGSFTNASSVLLHQPDGGFTGTVTETEYLCFYDSNTWTPSLTLPEGCQP